MGQFIKIFNIALVKGIPLVWVLECFALVLPNFLGLTVPVAFLVAFMLALGRLAETGEMLALRASGFSAGQVLWPFIALGAALTAAMWWTNHTAGPAGWHEFKNRFAAAVSKVASVDPEPRTFLQLADWKLFAGGVNRSAGAMTDVHLFKYREQAMTMTVTAKRGKYRLDSGRGILVTLYDGELARPSSADPSRIVRAKFESYELFVPFGEDVDVRREPIPTELTSARIGERLKEGVAPQLRHELVTERASRSAAAWTPLLFLWAAWPFGLRLERRGRAVGLAIAMGILFVHYGLAVFGISVGRRADGLSWTAPWAGDLALLVVGAVFARKGF